MAEEIQPPWVSYPGYGPGDFFWREAGEPWFAYVWEPFWKSLGAEQREKYLARWKPPEEWQKFYFDEGFQAWLDTVDD